MAFIVVGGAMVPLFRSVLLSLPFVLMVSSAFCWGAAAVAKCFSFLCLICVWMLKSSRPKSMKLAL